MDRSIAIEETWGELKKLKEEGKVKYLGISEATSEEIRRAHTVTPVSALQIEVRAVREREEGPGLTSPVLGFYA